MTSSWRSHRCAPMALLLSALIGGAVRPVCAQAVPASGQIEVAFSPNGAAQALVIKAIAAAQHEIHMLAYSFTSAPVTQALLAAHKRGVRIKLVVDHSHNLEQERSSKARAALSALANAGVEVRTTKAFAIHHDKVIVVDRKHVQLGSFNYSAAAQSRNSENVLVNWSNPELASAYLQHFTRNYAQSVLYRARY